MKEELLLKILEDLKNTESGEIVSVYWLVDKYKKEYPQVCKDKESLGWIWEELRKAAKKEGIDLFNAEDFDIASEYQIPSVVRRKIKDKTCTKENCNRIKFEAGGYMCSFKDVDSDIRKAEIDEESWNQLINEVFDKAKVLNWYDNYTNCAIMDGWYWNLTLWFENGKKLEYHGSNAAPTNLKKLDKAVRPYSKESFIEIEKEI